MKTTNKRKWLELIWVNKLLERYFDGRATEKEQYTIAHWNPEIGKDIAQDTLEPNEDTERIWKNIVAELHLTPKAPDKKMFQFYHYAVAASVILFISMSILFFKHTDQVETTQPKTHIVNSKSIPAGTDKAILTLEDGTEVVLTDHTNYNTNQVQSNGKQLVYNNLLPQQHTGAIQEIKYNYLTVPRGGQYYVKLADETEVWLNSESQLKFPTSFIAGKTRQVELVYGEAYFDVSPSSKHGGAKFKVNNQNQSIEVLGTEFNIKAYRDESKIYTTLVEGQVAVDFKNNHKDLIPNQKLTLNVLNHNVTIDHVDVQSEISWRDGLFYFKGDSLKDIMKIISRWYDVDVQFENKNLEEITFKGVLAKHQNLTEILEIIKNLSIIKSYNLYDKTLILN
ncbi:FecR family protein [uncultured Formosa sp.]|uniref:FecR family protein n=1 Tax=uncultured Formosa sp. TaxID=255435 RepID=UPI00261190CE|nr:FecR family protein [uncultured Formosa sp.]